MNTAVITKCNLLQKTVNITYKPVISSGEIRAETTKGTNLNPPKHLGLIELKFIDLPFRKQLVMKHLASQTDNISNKQDYIPLCGSRT